MRTLIELWSILTLEERRSAMRLVVPMLLSMMLEMAGVGLVVPGLAAMSSEGGMTLPPPFSSWLGSLGNPSRASLLMVGLAALLALYLFKAIFVLFVIWRQQQFVARIQNRISRSLYRSYLSQPWEFHLERNSSDMVRNIDNIGPIAAASLAVLGAVAESLVVLGIAALLIWYEPFGATMVGLLIICSTFVFDRITRRRLAAWGVTTQRHLGLTYKHLYEGLSGVKDIKVLGREDEFIDQFSMHRDIFVRLSARAHFLNQVPRFWYELLAVNSICLLTLIMLLQGKSAKVMIPTLGLFAAAAFRVLPSINRLVLATHSLRFASAAIATTVAELSIAPREIPLSPRRLSFTNVIRLERITYRYSMAPSNAIEEITLDIPRGRSIGFVGTSGAGKSTLVDIILGLLVPTAGRVSVDGVDILSELRAWQNQIGYVPQSIHLTDDTLRRNVALGVRDERIDDGAVRKALQAAQLDDFVARLPLGWETPLGERGVKLSGGQRQRVGIARALYHDPQVLVLDEATSALDTQTEASVMAAVEALHGKKTIVIVAHRLSTVANCDKVFKLEQGRLDEKTFCLADSVTL